MMLPVPFAGLERGVLFVNDENCHTRHRGSDRLNDGPGVGPRSNDDEVERVLGNRFANIDGKLGRRYDSPPNEVGFTFGYTANDGHAAFVGSRIDGEDSLFGQSELPEAKLKLQCISRVGLSG